MKIEVDLNKRVVIAVISVSLILFGIVGVIAYGTDSPAVFGHSVGEINWGDTIQGTVKASDFCVGTKCLNNLSGSGSSQWTASGNNIYNANSGYVGIGTASPTGRLDVVSRYYKAVSDSVGQGNPRCPCDTNSGNNAVECSEFETSDAVGSVCYDWYTSGGGWNTLYNAVMYRVVEEHYLFGAGKLGIGVASVDSNYRLTMDKGLKITDGSIVLTNSQNYASGITSTITGNGYGNQMNAIYGHATNTAAWPVNGVKGRTEGNGYGVIGETGPNGLAGIYGSTESSTGYAGYFQGNVLTTGNLQAVGITASGNLQAAAITASGDLAANSNVWGACHDVQLIFPGQWYTCNDGEFVTGLLQITSGGETSISKFRCCKL